MANAPSPAELALLCEHFFSNLTLEFEVENATYCPPIWDSVRCWPPALAETSPAVNCWDIFRARFGELHVARLSHLEGPLREATVRKHCGTSGQWEPRNYTDYSVCSAVLGNDFQRVQRAGAVVAWISFMAALISLLFVCVGLVIITCFRLTCTRMKLHKNLMTALAMRYVLDLVMFEASVTGRAGPTYMDSEWLCKSVGTLRLYTTIAIFLWMFNEGYHLHSRIATSIFNRKEHNKRFHFIGWVLPAPLVVLWAIMMTRDPRFTSGNCFAGVKKSPWIWLVVGPVTLALVGNIFFLINIIRVLVQRYRRQNMREVATLRRAVKATILLLPLLGVTNVLFFFNPEDNGPYELAYLVANSSLQGTFGMFVTIFYCFADHQVRKVLYSKCIRSGDLDRLTRFCWSCVYHTLCLRTEIGRGGDSCRSRGGPGSVRHDLRRHGTAGSAAGINGGTTNCPDTPGWRQNGPTTEPPMASRLSTAGLRDDDTCVTPIRMSPNIPHSPILLTATGNKNGILSRNGANGCRRQSAVDFSVSFASPAHNRNPSSPALHRDPSYCNNNGSAEQAGTLIHCASSPRLSRTGTVCGSRKSRDPSNVIRSEALLPSSGDTGRQRRLSKLQHQSGSIRGRESSLPFKTKNGKGSRPRRLSSAGEPPEEVPSVTDPAKGSNGLSPGTSARGILPSFKTNLIKNAREWLGAKTRSIRQYSNNNNNKRTTTVAIGSVECPSSTKPFLAPNKDGKGDEKSSPRPVLITTNNTITAGGSAAKHPEAANADSWANKSSLEATTPPVCPCVLQDVRRPSHSGSHRSRSPNTHSCAPITYTEEPRRRKGPNGMNESLPNGQPPTIRSVDDYPEQIFFPPTPRILVGSEGASSDVEISAGRRSSISFDFSEDGVTSVLLVGIGEATSSGRESSLSNRSHCSPSRCNDEKKVPSMAARYLSSTSARRRSSNVDNSDTSTVLKVYSPTTSPLLRRPRTADGLLRVEDVIAAGGLKEKSDETFV